MLSPLCLLCFHRRDEERLQRGGQTRVLGEHTPLFSRASRMDDEYSGVDQLYQGGFSHWWTMDICR